MKTYNVEIFGAISESHNVTALNENDAICKAADLAGLDEDERCYFVTYAVSDL